jgi:hypothetical protein
MSDEDECAESGRTYKWEIEPNPYNPVFDAFVTDSDEDALKAILDAAEMHLWDGNDSHEHGAISSIRTLKVTHNMKYDGKPRSEPV